MSEQPLPHLPFKTLGTHLKYLREHSHQTLSEVSGAVEIDERALERIELGAERPAEDILLLLISHFDMQDQEALQLWELAGYEGDMRDKPRPVEDVLQAGNKGMVMLLAVDMRTMYSDEMTAEGNQAGITLTFGQTGGQKQATPVARVGMSYEQAERVAQTLQQVLLRAKYLKGPRALPPSIETAE
jgi:hypothetical protein